MAERFGGRFLEGWPESDDALGDDGSLQPKADLFEDCEGLTIEVELPGVGPRDVMVTIMGDALVVEAERGFTRNGRQVRQLETSYGRMRREFQLPLRAQPTKALAEMKLGMLRIFVPQRVETATSTITLSLTGDETERHVPIECE